MSTWRERKNDKELAKKYKAEQNLKRGHSLTWDRVNIAKKTIIGLPTVITFGKYAGISVETLIHNYVGYARWLFNKMPPSQVKPEIFELLK